MSSESNKPNHTPEEAPIPKGRLARWGRVTGLAASVAGGVVAQGAKQLLKGQRPKMSQLLLTPANAKKLADQLAQLRGAAMKLGQLLSMDAGDFLPKELTDILSRLRQDAKSMPAAQLQQVLQCEWGTDWSSRFRYFSPQPIAAASIGQVHEAVTHDGLRLAIKIQYPGVRESIDSDIDNVAYLFRMTGLIPDKQDIRNLLQEAKKQLHEEADYLREAQCLQQYAALLAGDTRYLIPQVLMEHSTTNILAMTYVEGVPIESLDDAAADTRNRLAGLMFELMFRELFEFQLIQTDPNFANYRYNTQTQQLVLLDFGATRAMPSALVACYARAVQAAQGGQWAQLPQVAKDIGYFDDTVAAHHQASVVKLMELACEPVVHEGAYPFGQLELAQRIRDEGLELAKGRDFWHAPPIDSVFLHRKLAGVFLLASRYKANVDVASLVANSLQTGGYGIR